ncbi:MAG: hypothetical protein Q8K75_10790 [Chlamydiales bacterium]|nr:hypothetical protein [Chlamydiales bacterium]
MTVQLNLWSTRSTEAQEPNEVKRFIKNVAKIAFTVAAYYTAIKAVEFVRENGVDAFRDQAHGIVKAGLQDIQEGRYLESWGKSLPARVSFAGDTVVQAALLPISFVKAVFHSAEVIFTWGATATKFSESTYGLLENGNRVARGAFGAVISPNVSYNGREKNFIGIFLAALAACTPKAYSYNSRIGWSSHYSFGNGIFYT